MIPLRDNIRSQSTPYVNIGIIVSCVFVFILQLTSRGEDMLMPWAFVPQALISPSAWADYGFGHIAFTAVSAMFMHGDFLHLGSNMLFLWVFGDNIEDRMGHIKYLLFYLLCGVAATLAHSVVTLFSNIPMVGASGAIAGVMGAYFVLCKQSSIRTLVPTIMIIPVIVEVPAILFIGMWFVLQLLYGLGMLGLGAGIAFWAHIGGAVAGYYLARRFGGGRKPKPPEPRVIDLRIIE
ncbi:MAG TPA: rhomboid family intramembrane serine protease [Armatimonadetes bacterium]|jgi:membrane associated rhomboid family serine protease|nr:rhomboid family intramembrane serine protease [Armatimonadota bacterium]